MIDLSKPELQELVSEALANLPPILLEAECFVMYAHEDGQQWLRLVDSNGRSWFWSNTIRPHHGRPRRYDPLGHWIDAQWYWGGRKKV